MNTSNLLPGLLWIEKRIREISASLPNPVQAIEWQRPEQRTREQFARGSISVKIIRGENFQEIEFLETELVDVEAIPEIQRRLEESSKLSQGRGVIQNL